MCAVFRRRKERVFRALVPFPAAHFKRYGAVRKIAIEPRRRFLGVARKREPRKTRRARLRVSARTHKIKPLLFDGKRKRIRAVHRRFFGVQRARFRIAYEELHLSAAFAFDVRRKGIRTRF